MTALHKFERLESMGLWRETPDDQKREVIVSFGDATLIIRDGSEAALSHWSLAAIVRDNPGQRPAIFRPGADQTESIELDDETMVKAIEKVRKAIAKTKPHHGRVRLLILGLLIAGILLLGTAWLPGALIRHTASVVPPTKQEAVGDAILARVNLLAGDTCRDPLGQTALTKLRARLAQVDVSKVAILSDAGFQAAMLPGGLLVMNKALVEDHDTPDVVAGQILASVILHPPGQAFTQFLEHAGIGPSLSLLTTGDVPDAAMQSYAEHIATREGTGPVSNDRLLAAFSAAKVPSTPYAYAVDPTGERTIALIEGDPMAGQSYEPLLSDGDWVSLQEICGG